MNIKKPLVPIITSMTSERLSLRRNQRRKNSIFFMLIIVTLITLIVILLLPYVLEQSREYRGTFVTKGGIIKIGHIH